MYSALLIEIVEVSQIYILKSVFYFSCRPSFLFFLQTHKHDWTTVLYFLLAEGTAPVQQKENTP